MVYGNVQKQNQKVSQYDNVMFTNSQSVLYGNVVYHIQQVSGVC